jgi:kelch-like protein 1/4/5
MLIIEAMRYHLAPEKRLIMKSIRTKPRKSTLGFLYCLGGIDNDKSNYDRKYDFLFLYKN